MEVRKQYELQIKTISCLTALKMATELGVCHFHLTNYRHTTTTADENRSHNFDIWKSCNDFRNDIKTKPKQKINSAETLQITLCNQGKNEKRSWNKFKYFCISEGVLSGRAV